MNKTEALRRAHQHNTLQQLGFTAEQVNSLRRISVTLHRWHEFECGTDAGSIERDETTGKPYIRTPRGKLYPVADREAGALKRLAAIVHDRNIRQPFAESPLLSTYIQTDPRGQALYILRPSDVPEGKDPAAYYSRGICVY
jgi:hypothetical protein